MLEYYPPLFFMGLRIDFIAPDYQSLRASLPLRWYARNFHGTMFGGHLCAASDPLPALMCARIFQMAGKSVEVWTRANAVEFIKPARGRVEMRIEVSDKDIATMSDELDRSGKTFHEFQFNFYDRGGAIIAAVKNTVYLKRRQSRAEPWGI